MTRCQTAVSVTIFVMISNVAIGVERNMVGGAIGEQRWFMMDIERAKQVMGMREKLIEILSKNFSEYCRLSVIAGSTKITGVTLDAGRFADHLIANGVTIPVRCKECKHYVDSPYDNGDMMCDKWGEWIFPNDDDFCSCGERRTNNDYT